MVKQLQSLIKRPAAFKPKAKYLFLAAVVPVGIKQKISLLHKAGPGIGIGPAPGFVHLRIDGPAGEHPGCLRYVILGVAAINPQCMQLHYFAGIIFVQAPQGGFSGFIPPSPLF